MQLSSDRSTGNVDGADCLLAFRKMISTRKPAALTDSVFREDARRTTRCMHRSAQRPAAFPSSSGSIRDS
jgi:hypothetical protein